MTAACPACPPGLEAVAARPAEGETVHLSLPGIHCAGCISGVERTLRAVPGIRAARVNLGRRRVRVTSVPGLGAAPALAALRDAGYEAHELDEAALAPADATGRLLLARVAVAGFAMMNVMVLSVAVWSGATEVTRALFHWVSAAVALPALAFAAQPFFTDAWAGLRHGRMTMDLPIAVAIALAAGSSLHETLTRAGTHAWFDAALSLTFFLLAGRYLDHRARAAARSAAAALAALELPRAVLIDGDARRPVAVADLRPGDRIALTPGARAPVDGVAEDAATLDRSALTGEAVPATVPAGAAVAAGEVVLAAPLTLRVTARAEDSALRRLAALVEVAETARHRHSGMAERAARAYAPLVHGLAAAAFLGWWLATGSAAQGIAVATATLIISCPCALGLAVPAVTAAVTGRLFRAGLLLKSATALERLAEIDTVLLDKTGTLTEGTATLPDLPPAAAGVALSLARASAHPAAQAVAAALEGAVPAPLADLREVPGEGVSGLWDGAPVFLGRGGGGTELRLPGATHPLPLEERLRPGAAAAVRALRDAGHDVRLVTGDAPARAHALARRLGIDAVHAGVRPEAKAALVTDLARAGRRVLMVGDGLNDTGALAAAHASMAPATALDAARVASDAVILRPDLTLIPKTLAAARSAMRRVAQNLWIATAYNAVAIPVALAGLATPLAAAIAMSTSSVTVVLNAVRR
ncbi:heavy metal translocating P-type ATPase [Jannaschia sp. Os4]|uniref:HAD-IC family P-type ATPase n=1 Tax=Jannaschia sp. Os4 TaxID=2807617 RepID=UPI00193AD9DD|nr:heavy metal translocating P-type ATPase [Jannaschia sp. Os4]